MKNSSLTLYIEINNLRYAFFVGESDEHDNFKTVYKLELPLKGENNKISDLEKVSEMIKKNVFIAEQKLGHTFKEIVLILENFNPTFINLSGYKKLNGSQILRENITYILNTLKSCVDETEPKKNVLHIFNSKFYLDKKKVENLPIGLFGDFYNHELSFTLINSNDYKNLNNVFNKINLKIKKILIKSFINGVNVSNNYKNTDTFSHIKINENNTQIFFFENNSLKFEQNFKFGIDIIMKDISKITSLTNDQIKMILDKIEIFNDIPEDELIEETFFNDNVYRKIKKKLIYEIVLARIKEISEIILLKNINFVHYNKVSNNIFLEINHKLQFKCLNEIYKKFFSMNGSYNLNFINFSDENMLSTANKLVHFGWKKEAIPISMSKKSFISSFFDRIFG
tara:strand:- start:2831 stop:4021 length:1191 start_codon:yes stop_codon:yes gene_type:complete